MTGCSLAEGPDGPHNDLVTDVALSDVVRVEAREVLDAVEPRQDVPIADLSSLPNDPHRQAHASNSKCQPYAISCQDRKR